MRNCWLYFSIVALAFAGCASTTDNNCEAANSGESLGAFIANEFGGRYEKCLDELRSELARSQNEVNELESRAAELTKTAVTLSGENRLAALELAQLHSEQAEIFSRLDAAKDNRDINSDQLEALQVQSKELNAELQQLQSNNAADREEATRLSIEQNSLKKQLDQFLEPN